MPYRNSGTKLQRWKGNKIMHEDAGMFAVLVVLVTLLGGGFVGFWAWVRALINRNTAEVAAIKARVTIIEQRCRERRDNFQELYEELKKHGEQLARIEAMLNQRRQ